MMFSEQPTVLQRSAPRADSMTTRGRAPVPEVLVHDPDLVVHQVDLGELGDSAGRSAFRTARSSALTGPSPSAAVCIHSSPTRILTVACDRLPLAAPLLHDHREVLEREGRLVAGRGAAQEHLERSLGRLELKPPVLQLLDALQHRRLVLSRARGRVLRRACRTLRRPETSLTTTRISLPTAAGSTC